MKKAIYSSLSLLLLIFSGLFYLDSAVIGQDVSSESPALSEEINKIVSASCMPCHSSTGGMMSRGKLNFTEWTEYSAETQKKKAEKIYSEMKKGAMPPKSAREKRPEIVPTKDQIDFIKKWSESF